MIKIVVGTGNERVKGGPPSQILTCTVVNALVAVIVVPAIVATGNGAGGASKPRVDATGFVVLGTVGNPEVENGETKGLRKIEA